MADTEPLGLERLYYGLAGGFLGALIGISVQFWLDDFNWWIVGGCGLFGFIFAWAVGEQAIDFLKSVWWWS